VTAAVPVVITLDDPRSADVAPLLDAHLAFARAVTAARDVHALPADELACDEVTFYSARLDGTPVAVGALTPVDADTAEIKSMHTAESARGQGIGRAMVQHLIDAARRDGYRRVSLETGSMAAFAPARALYAAFGFEPCPPFGGYAPSPTRVCMSLDLSPPHR